MKKHKVEQEYISTNDLAAIYGVNVQIVRKWCREGKIDCKAINGRYYIKKDIQNKDEK